MGKSRKTQPPSYEVVKRSMDKLYQQYSIKLRREDDEELIAYVESKKEQGISPTQLLRDLYIVQKTERSGKSPQKGKKP